MKRNHQITKAAVIIPPITDFYTTPHRFSALGAGILGRLLEANGIAVHFFNFPVKNSCKRTFPLPETLNYLAPYIIPNETGRSTFFTHYYLFGPTVQECVQEVLSVSPDIIFVSCFAFCYADSTIALCKELKQALPNVSIITGGGGAAVHPAYFISSGSIDYIVTGEAELSAIALIHYIRGDISDSTAIPNLITKESTIFPGFSKIFTNNSSLEPGYRISFNKNRLRIDLTISRGCPLQCAFCSNHLCHGTEFRRVDEHKINKLIFDISRSIPFEPTSVDINFEDDNLLIDSKFWFKVLYLFKEQFPRAHFFAENGLDYRLLTEEAASSLIRLGMAQFNLAIGNVNKDASDVLSRSSSFDHYDTLLTLFENNSIPVISYFIAGFYNDNRGNIAENLHFLWKRTTLAGISMFYPVPGLRGFTDYLMFRTGEAIRCCGSSAFPWNKSIDTATLVTAFRLSRFINLIKIRPHNPLEKELIGRSFEKKVLHTVVRFKKEKTIIEVPNQDHELAGMVLKNMQKFN
jgi:hypothetical protein